MPVQWFTREMCKGGGEEKAGSDPRPPTEEAACLAAITWGPS